MQALMDKHPSVKQTRVIGLFGCIDIQKNSKGPRGRSIRATAQRLQASS